MVPKLRFAEFREAWKIKTLENVADNLDSKRVPITSEMREKGTIPYYGASGVIDYVKDFIFDGNLLCISEDGANLVDRTYPIAFSIAGKTWVNNHAHVLRFKNAFTQILVENYLNAINLEDFLTGMAQPKLNRGKLDIIPIPLPSPAEQQKLATFLTTLDTLLAAENEKLRALQAHKKGLMQVLFPAEGETVPRVRFGEFEGEWEEKALGEITTWSSGGTPLKDNPEYWGGDIPWISASSMRGIEYSDSKLKLTVDGLKNGSRLAKKGSLLLLVRGSMLFNCIPVGIAGKDVAFNQDLKSIVVSKEIDTMYLLNWFLASEPLLMSMVGGTGIGAGKLETSELQKIAVPFPTYSEQQKIAACLTALDALLAAQSEKIEVLKRWKKGLMQQLFPNLNSNINHD